MLVIEAGAEYVVALEPDTETLVVTAGLGPPRRMCRRASTARPGMQAALGASTLTAEMLNAGVAVVSRFLTKFDAWWIISICASPNI